MSDFRFQFDFPQKLVQFYFRCFSTLARSKKKQNKTKTPNSQQMEDKIPQLDTLPQLLGEETENTLKRNEKKNGENGEIFKLLLKKCAASLHQIICQRETLRNVVI